MAIFGFPRFPQLQLTESGPIEGISINRISRIIINNVASYDIPYSIAQRIQRFV